MTSSIAFASREREQSILAHLPQVKLLARRIHRRCPPSVLLEDLESAGVTGLIEAANRYDRRRNVKFKTLADHRIRGAMLDYLRSLDPLPRAVRRFVRDRDTTTVHLQHGRDCCPSETEIAATLGVSMERYRRLSQLAHASDTVSLDSQDAHVSCDGTPHTATWLREVDHAIQALPSRERSVILSLRDGYAVAEIASRFEVTPGRVSQIKKEAIIRLRRAAIEAGFTQTGGARHVLGFKQLVARFGRLNEAIMPLKVVGLHLTRLAQIMPLGIRMLLKGKVQNPLHPPIQGVEHVRRILTRPTRGGPV